MCDSLPHEFDHLLEHLKANGGRIVISLRADPLNPLNQDRDRWLVGYEFGAEEPDNPENDMAGGAAYGMGPDLDSAIGQVADQVGLP